MTFADATLEHTPQRDCENRALAHPTTSTGSKAGSPSRKTVVDLTRQLEERGEELDAARAANREIITCLNSSPRRVGDCRDAAP